MIMSRNQFIPTKPDTIDALLKYCHTRSYPNKRIIITPGESAELMYYILEGSVSVLTEDEEGRELILGYLNKGEFLGELGLFMKPDKRYVTVRAREKVKIAEIGYDRLRTLLENELSDYKADIFYIIGLQVTSRLLNTRRKVSRLAFMDVSGRIAKTLLDLCKEPDAMTHPDGMQISVSRQEISRIVGCSREMAGRVLKKLEEDGMIKASGKTIVVFETR
jgi:CRP/FNR family cyclic AMP-dependent transcriptional regulator